MKLFNFLNKRESDKSPEKILRHLVDYMPDFYKTGRQYVYCLEFLEHREWGLALESLIELADESGHYFSEKYWLDLAECADGMHLSDAAAYCRKQIDRNERDIKSKTTFGWTTVKLDDNHFNRYTAAKLMEEWTADRRKKDDVARLIKTNGIHLKSYGRTGCIYIVNQGKIAELDFELGFNGLILHFNNLTHWALPKKQILSVEEKQQIKADILQWARQTRNPVGFDD